MDAVKGGEGSTDQVEEKAEGHSGLAECLNFIQSTRGS